MQNSFLNIENTRNLYSNPDSKMQDSFLNLDNTRNLYSNPVNLKTVPINKNYPDDLPIPHIDNDFLIFPNNNDAITPDSDVTLDLDFPVNVDFNFTFDDLSFADDLLLDPNLNPGLDPGLFGSDEVVTDLDCSKPDPNSSQGSNFVANFDDCKIINENLGNNCTSSDRISQLKSKKRKKEIANDNAEEIKTNKIRKSSNSKEIKRDYDGKTDKLRRTDANVSANESKCEVLSEDGFSIGGGGGSEDERRKKARLVRNRESANLSRQRKKKYIGELEEKVKLMVSTITNLNGKVAYFMSENATLREQLSSGVVGPPPTGTPRVYPPMGYPWVAYPQGCLVPIPRLKPEERRRESTVRKSKEKKVASVSLFGFLFLMLLFGGILYGGVGKGTVFTVDKGMERTRNCANGEFFNGSDPLVVSLFVPRNNHLVEIDGNLIIQSVLASEKAMASQVNEERRVSKETGLAIHRSYPPYPTPRPGSNNWRRPHLDRNQGGPKEAIGSGSADGFTPIGSGGKLQWFREGLAGPMLSSGMCTEVFQFVISTPGSSIPATSVTNITSENRLNSTVPHRTINKRILQKHDIPFKDNTHNTTEDHVQPREPTNGFQNKKSSPSVVVSVLVDPREIGDVDSEGVIGSKSLSRIFIVVLIDSVKYVTYSCRLPFMSSGSHLVTT